VQERGIQATGRVRERVPVNIAKHYRKSMMPSTMENKPLVIPESKQWKGVVVYCYKCNRDVKEICGESGATIRSCQNFNKHVFKVYVHVPGTKNKRKTKKLETRDINEAVKQAIEFEKEIKSGHYNPSVQREAKPKVKREETNNPLLLKHALARYIVWLRNEGVPAHMQKERQKESIKDVERAFKGLAECMKGSRVNLETYMVGDINDHLVL